MEVTRISYLHLKILGDIVRGVQCHLSHPFGTLALPLLYGSMEKSHGVQKERCVTIPLFTEGRSLSIRSVAIRYGALVDSVTLTLSSGEIIRAGGAGGSDESTLIVPEGQKVIGFYGGEN
jgi:hypothetical protein